MIKIKAFAMLIAILLFALAPIDEVNAACTHKWVYVTTKPSTCMVQGYTEYKCSRCGVIRRDPLALSPHVYVWKYYTTWHQTCAHDTFDEYHKRCQWCDYRDPLTHCTDMNHRGDGFKHRYEYEGWVNGYEYVTGQKPPDLSPTCTSPGWCWETSAPCGYGHGNPPWGWPPYCTLAAHRKVNLPALGHSWSSWRFNRTVTLPFGTSPGINEYIRNCSRCYINEYRYESYYDSASPTVYVNPASSAWIDRLTVAIRVSDTGGSGLRKIETAFTDSAVLPSSGWTTTDIGSPGIGSWESGMVIDRENQWYLYIRAYDYCGNSSGVSAGPYKIDRTPPDIEAVKTGEFTDGVVKVAISASDDLSGMKRLAYCWSYNASRPVSGWVESQITGCIAETDALLNAVYLHTEANDNAGNLKYEVFGPYDANPLKITGVTVSGSWNHWRGQTDLFGKQLDVMPHRFLSFEKIKVTVNTKGFADRVTVRLSPELEAMSFTDISGNIYDYRSKTGRTITFPQDSTVSADPLSDESIVIWEYILPLAASTLDWNDRRLRSPYHIDVTAYKGSDAFSVRIYDIDITGNIYNLIYMQPIR